MAVTLNTGSGGETVAADVVGSQQYQWIKIAVGGSNAAAAAPGDATNGLTVDLGANNDVVVSGTATVQIAGTANIAFPVSASVLAVQVGTWNVNVATTATVQIAGTANIAFPVSASVLAVQVGTWNVNVATTATVQIAGTANIAFPVSASVLAVQSGTWNVNIATTATVQIAGTANIAFPVSASVLAVQSGSWSVSVTGTANVAFPVSASVIPGGNVAHDAGDAGNPVKIGFRAVSTLQAATMVAASDRTDGVACLDGAQLVRNCVPLGDMISQRTVTSASASTVLTSFNATASQRNYVRGYSIVNTSSTNGYIDFRDGTAGSVLWTVALPANGGANMISTDAIFRTSLNTALAYQVNANLADVFISVSGFQSKA